MGSAYAVTGEIVFSGEAPERASAVHIRVEDVSYSDAPAKIFAEEVLRDVRISGQEPLSFSLPVGDPNPSADYSVSVHVDVDGDGKVSPGDFISVQSNPVLTYGRPNRVTVPVKRV